MADSAERAYCVHCAAEMAPTGEACPRCGRAQGPGGPAARLLPPKRPTGVLVVGIGILFWCAVSLAIVPSIAKSIHLGWEKADGLPGLTYGAAWGITAVTAVLVVAAAAVVVYFLLKMRNWARIVVLVCYCLTVVTIPLHFLPGQIEVAARAVGVGHAAVIARYVIEEAWSVFVVVYLFKAGAAFRPRPVGSGGAERVGGVLRCPHCGERGISAWQKLCAGPGSPATCGLCGEKSTVPWWSFFVAAIPMGMGAFAGVAVGLWPGALLFLGGMALSAGLLVATVPMVKK